jgi:glycosyltransferase involved in cell wall biosynthesis
VRIVFDCRSVFPGAGAGGRAAAALARALPQALGRHELLLLMGGRRPAGKLLEADNVRTIATDAAPRDPVFEQVRLPELLAEYGADLYHGAGASVPIAARARRIATVADLAFRRRPELVDDATRGYLDRWTLVSCRVADAVVVPSEFTKRELVELYKCDRDKIHIVPNAVDEAFFRIERRPLPGPPFVLHVGSLEARKNVVPLLEGFARLIEGDDGLPHELVLCGSVSTAARAALEGALEQLPSLRGRVQALGHVPEERLHELYGAAGALCFLSDYEGFALPPLEAMAASVPCVVSDRSALPELLGEAALLVDPHDPDDLALALRTALREPAVSVRAVRRGLLVARQSTWRASARSLAALYELVASLPALPAILGGVA